MSLLAHIPGSTDILYVMALENEYGPHLRSRITPLMTGVGPVEAAVVLTHALAKLEQAGKLPALVVSLGSPVQPHLSRRRSIRPLRSAIETWMHRRLDSTSA